MKAKTKLLLTNILAQVLPPLIEGRWFHKCTYQQLCKQMKLIHSSHIVQRLLSSSLRWRCHLGFSPLASLINERIPHQKRSKHGEICNCIHPISHQIASQFSSITHHSPHSPLLPRKIKPSIHPFFQVSRSSRSTLHFTRSNAICLWFNNLLDVLLQALSCDNSAILSGFELLGDGLVLLASIVHKDAGDLNDTDEAKEEVDCGKPGRVY